MGFRRLCNRAIGLALLTSLSLWAQRPAPHGASPLAPRRRASVSTGYKGIFEPVNYPQDINLTDVFFTGADEGWVSGEHATILHTTDEGKTWTAQVGGDATSTEHPIHSLRFLDSKHGWAIKDDPARLLRTLDGQNWEEVQGSFPPGVYALDYVFTSVRHGILLGSNNGGFYVTNDGGRHWQPVAPCRLSATVQGLTRIEDCRVRKLQMLSARAGYALVDWSQGIAFLRTNDAGEHWQSIVPDVTDCCGPDVFFTDLNHGVLFYNNGKTYVTDNGGKNWRALLSATVGLTSGGQTPPLRFTDPEIGWVVGASPDNSDTFRVSFSTDAGQHWKMSANIKFPAERGADLKFSFPRRDRAYVIGPHGMIYRYRVVPANYAAANALDAPPMPRFSAAELSAKADTIRRDIGALRAKLAALPGTNQSSGGANAMGPQPSSTGGSSAGMSASGSGGQLGAADTGQGTASNTAAAAGGFSQQSDLSTTADAIASGDSGSAGFTQDTAPPSDVLANCCAAAVQQLQTDTSGFVTQIPPVTSQMRPLNLIVAGLQLVATLMNQSQGLWTQFKTLKHAPSAQAASQALQQLSTTLNTVQQASSTGLQNPGAWFATNAPAAFTQDVSVPGVAATAGAVLQTTTSASGDPAQVGTTGTQPAQSGTAGAQPSQPNDTQKTTESVVDQAKQKLKSKIKIPW
jgi:photosystem II stability/assembly factor-like uncharacterized protein